MTFSAAMTQLLTLNFTDLVSNNGALDIPPNYPDIPALVVVDISQPFIEGLKAENVVLSVGSGTIFIDHVLLVAHIGQGTYSSRWLDRITFVDRYFAAIQNDMLLAGNLAEPLALVALPRGKYNYRNREYSAIVFRHQWVLEVT